MSSVPSAAAQVPHTELEDPLQRYGKALSLASLANQQEIQKQTMTANDLENQGRQLQVAQAQQDQKDQINFRQAFQDANGDPEKTVQLAAKAGVGPKLLVPFQQGILEHKTKLLTYNKDQQAFAQSQADLQKGAWDTVDKAPEADKPQIYQQQLQGLQQLGVDVSKMPPQYDPQAFKTMGAVVSGHKQLLEDTFKGSEANKNQNQADLAATENLLKKQDLNFGEKIPQLNDALTQRYQVLHPGQPLPPPFTLGANASKSDFDRVDKMLEGTERAQGTKSQQDATNAIRQQTFDLNNTIQNGLKAAALDQAAERYHSTGVLPPTARGAAGMKQNQQIMNRAAELHPDANLAENSAEYKANSASLKNVTGTLDTLTAFENTGLKNLKQFTDLAEKIPDTGVPWLNRPIRTLSKDVVGSENMAAVEAARNVALREIARVTNDPKLSGTLTDTSRKEVSDLIPQNATFQQIKSVAKVLQQDMANVHGSLAEQKADIQRRLGGKPATEQPNTPPPTDFFSQFGGKPRAK